MEGFGDDHAVATRGSASSFYVMIRDNTALSTGEDGAEVEGSVAAFFFDVTDAAGDEPHDAIKYPGSYLADILETCKVNGSRANGVDHLTYCYERRIDPAVTGNPDYFPGRSDPTSFSESATEPSSWDADKIRAVWVENLYGNL